MKYFFLTVLALLTFGFFGAVQASPKHDVKARAAMDVFGKQIAKEYQLELLNTGLGSLADSSKGLWALNLVSHENQTLEQGRELATAIAKKLVQKVYTDPLFADYCRIEARPGGSSAVKQEYVAFRLAYWDKNVNRPLHPYLAQIRLVDGSLYFHYADPKTQALQEPIVEALNLPADNRST